MKIKIAKTILIILIIITIISLTGCYEERGYAYKHLNNYEPLKPHGEYKANETNFGNKTIGGVYEELKNNLCNTNPHCCNKFTEEEIKFHELEKRAISENNELICEQIPEKELIIKCPPKDDTIYYSKERCKQLIQQTK